VRNLRGRKWVNDCEGPAWKKQHQPHPYTHTHDWHVVISLYWLCEGPVGTQWVWQSWPAGRKAPGLPTLTLALQSPLQINTQNMYSQTCLLRPRKIMDEPGRYGQVVSIYTGKLHRENARGSTRTSGRCIQVVAKAGLTVYTVTPLNSFGYCITPTDIQPY
jgi:hypothetical protein